MIIDQVSTKIITTLFSTVDVAFLFQKNATLFNKLARVVYVLIILHTPPVIN